MTYGHLGRSGLLVSRIGLGTMKLRLSRRRAGQLRLRRACEASLRRLGTDHIDLDQMHHVDRATPWDEIWQAMEQLVREGKITYVAPATAPAAVALAWLLHNPVVATTVVGVMTTEELRADLDGLSVRLDQQILRRLDEIWPGPGEAPRSYAW